MLNKEVVSQLEDMKKSNERTIAGIIKSGLNDFNKGYISALKFQNVLIKLKLHA